MVKYAFALGALALAVFACTHAPLGATTPSNPYEDTSYSESIACTAGACAGTTPVVYSDGGASAGASLVNIDSFSLLACAWGADAGFTNIGQQFQDAGAFLAYGCDSYSQQCYRDQQLDQAIVVSGQSCITFPHFKVGVITKNHDTVEFVPTGVVVNGIDGGPVTMRIYTHAEPYRP